MQEKVIEAVRSRIEVEYIAYAQRKAGEEEGQWTRAFYEGYRLASEMLALDIGRLIRDADDEVKA